MGDDPRKLYPHLRGLDPAVEDIFRTLLDEA
jgi:hypothetical protein